LAIFFPFHIIKKEAIKSDWDFMIPKNMVGVIGPEYAYMMFKIFKNFLKGEKIKF